MEKEAYNTFIAAIDINYALALASRENANTLLAAAKEQAKLVHELCGLMQKDYPNNALSKTRTGEASKIIRINFKESIANKQDKQKAQGRIIKMTFN